MKGFVFPDRHSDDIYFATDNRVWAFSDTPTGLTGEGKAVVGAPSFDQENRLAHVGTEAGVFYAVSLPPVP